MTAEEVKTISPSVEKLFWWQKYYEAKLAIIAAIKERKSEVDIGKEVPVSVVTKLKEEGYEVCPEAIFSFGDGSWNESLVIRLRKE